MSKFETENNLLLTSIPNLIETQSSEFLEDFKVEIKNAIDTTENLILQNRIDEAIATLSKQRRYKNIFKTVAIQNSKCDTLTIYNLGKYDGVYTALVELVQKIIKHKDTQQTLENVLNRKYIIDILSLVNKKPLIQHKTISDTIGIKANYLNELMSLLIKSDLINKYPSGKYSYYSLTEKGAECLRERDRQTFNINVDPMKVKHQQNRYDSQIENYKYIEVKYEDVSYHNYTKNQNTDHQTHNRINRLCDYKTNRRKVK